MNNRIKMPLHAAVKYYDENVSYNVVKDICDNSEVISNNTLSECIAVIRDFCKEHYV